MSYGQVPPLDDNGHPAYGSLPPPGYYQPGFVPIYDYASWGRRLAGWLIDGLLRFAAGSPAIAGYVMVVLGLHFRTDVNDVTTLTSDVNPVAYVLIGVGGLLSVGEFVWNTCYRQGRTGASVGKSVMHLQLIKEETGQPIGAGMSFVRQLCHALDGFCYIGYLWPLWDTKRQTFADKVLTTVVINRPPAG